MELFTKIFIYTLILLIFLKFFFKTFVGIESFYSPSNYWLWWEPTRSTRNMSYDLRGDIPLYPTYIGPWNISSYYPVHNKPLWMIS